MAIYENKVNEINNIEQYIDFNAIKVTDSKLNDYEDFKEILYLSNTTTELVISNGDGVSQGNNIYLNKKRAKGVIITAGDVKIDGNVNFEGTIISKGKVIVKDGTVATLSSNKKVVDYIVAKNYEKFTGVFKNDSANGTSNIEVDAAAVIANKIQSIPKENIIKTGNWRLVK
ncbi:hypothetical protein SDC9_100013 [bioreactor metagenome]|uniref:Uncharacterized protein n=1 Tax=bioreactor metagenome TaxID=1076179 RepID=A0A645AKI9_9ZZZZ